MKAVRIHEHGGPEVVRFEDAPEPTPRANEVLIDVKACALNHVDMWVRGGLPGLNLEMPHTLGSDAAGVVVEVGELCTRVKPGDRVLVAPGRSSWQTPECLRGEDNFSRDFGLFGYQYPGVHAERIAIPETNALPIPGGLSFEEAASVPLVFQTAWHMLGADVGLNLSHLFARQLTLQGSFMGRMGELWDVLRCFAKGLLKPVVDKVFPMSEAARAHAYLTDKKQFGKVVLAP